MSNKLTGDGKEKLKNHSFKMIVLLDGKLVGPANPVLLLSYCLLCPQDPMLSRYSEFIY